MTIEVAHSEVESFLICERRHFYNYGLKIRPRQVSIALYRGSLGHLALQIYYQALIDGKSRQDAEALAYGTVFSGLDDITSVDNIKVQTELGAILKAYFEFYAENDYHPVEIERRVKVELDENTVMPFTIDAIMATSKGYLVVDHKFSYNFFKPDILRILPQLVKYKAALRQVGFEVSGGEYNEIRYQKVQGVYQFRRTFVPISSERTARTLAEHREVSRRIANRKALEIEEWDRRALRVANKFSCEKCPFTDICAGDLDGSSRDLLLDTHYEEAPDRYAGLKVYAGEEE